MNKYQRAIKRIRNDYLNNHNPDCDVLEELVKRATPKKAIKTYIDIPVLGEFVSERYNAYECSNCKKQIDDDYAGFEYPNYCKYCGQAIDWSEEE